MQKKIIHQGNVNQNYDISFHSRYSGYCPNMTKIMNPAGVQRKESSAHSLGMEFTLDTVETIVDFLHRVELALPLTQHSHLQVSAQRHLNQTTSAALTCLIQHHLQELKYKIHFGIHQHMNG